MPRRVRAGSRGSCKLQSCPIQLTEHCIANSLRRGRPGMTFSPVSDSRPDNVLRGLSRRNRSAEARIRPVDDRHLPGGGRARQLANVSLDGPRRMGLGAVPVLAIVWRGGRDLAGAIGYRFCQVRNGYRSSRVAKRFPRPRI